MLLLLRSLSPADAATMDTYEVCTAPLAPEVELACDCYNLSRYKWWNGGTGATTTVWDAPAVPPSSSESSLMEIEGTCFDLRAYVNAIPHVTTRMELAKLLRSKGKETVYDNQPLWTGFVAEFGLVKALDGRGVITNLLSMDEIDGTGGNIHFVPVFVPGSLNEFEVRDEEQAVVSRFRTGGGAQPLETYFVDLVGDDEPELVVRMSNGQTWYTPVADPNEVHEPPQ